MEEFKTLAFLTADFLMVAAGAICGWKFLKKKNYLLGLEWLVVATSGTNFFFWAIAYGEGYEDVASVLYSIAYYFDAFSRAFGFPVIAIAGLMAVTHRYRPSKFTDVMWFLGSMVGAVILTIPYFTGLEDLDAPWSYVEQSKPVFYLLAWTIYSGFLGYFAWRLFRVGERLHGWGVLVALVAGQAIATIYDFFHIPGDDAEHTLFYILALSTWAYSLFAIYHAYCALERAERKRA